MNSLMNLTSIIFQLTLLLTQVSSRPRARNALFEELAQDFDTFQILPSINIDGNDIDFDHGFYPPPKVTLKSALPSVQSQPESLPEKDSSSKLYKPTKDEIYRHYMGEGNFLQEDFLSDLALMQELNADSELDMLPSQAYGPNAPISPNGLPTAPFQFEKGLQFVPDGPSDQGFVFHQNPIQSPQAPIIPQQSLQAKPVYILPNPLTQESMPESDYLMPNSAPEGLKNDFEHLTSNPQMNVLEQFEIIEGPYQNYVPYSQSNFAEKALSTATNDPLGDPDQEHTTKINNPVQLSGPKLLNSYSYKTDGNYKMQLTLNSENSLPFALIDFSADKCNDLTEGVSIINPETSTVTIEIDLTKCKYKCDEEVSQDLGSIESLNVPIKINFGMVPQGVKINNRNGMNQIARYELSPSASLFEDYVIDFDTETKLQSQVGIDINGQAVIKRDNLQFNFFTYTDGSYEHKTSNLAGNGNLVDFLTQTRKSTNLSIEPINGFNPNSLTSLPETCFITNKSDNHQKITTVFDMLEDTSDADNHTCVSGLKYQPETGNWRFGAGFMEGDVITCQMRLCANNADSACNKTVSKCRYYQ